MQLCKKLELMDGYSHFAEDYSRRFEKRQCILGSIMRIEFTLRGLLTIFFRQKTKFLTAFVLVLLVGAGFAIFSTPFYESTGSLLVKFGSSARPEVVNPERQASQAEISQTGHE